MKTPTPITPAAPVKKRHTPKRLARFGIYEIEVGPAVQHVVTGRVLLHEGALRHEVEHALVAHGLYCPRGQDTLEWLDGEAVVCDAAGDVLVRLYQHTRTPTPTQGGDSR